MPRPQLYEKINFGVERMVEAGLEIEAQRLYSNKNLPALQTLGYQSGLNTLKEIPLMKP